MIAVVEGTEQSIQQIHVYPDTKAGRTEARKYFVELVVEYLTDCDEVREDMARARAESCLDPAGSRFEYGDYHVEMLESGVFLHSEN